MRFTVATAAAALLYRSDGLRLRAHGRGALCVGTLLSAGYCFQSAALLRTSARRAAALPPPMRPPPAPPHAAPPSPFPTDHHRPLHPAGVTGLVI